MKCEVLNNKLKLDLLNQNQFVGIQKYLMNVIYC